ncbi:MAG: helix-turn-helix transcriptional regulator [Candidatus Aminicenantes bacterium]|jgi:transcriptional regulator with XRE-family HTH domain
MKKYRQRKRLNPGPIAARLRKVRGHFGYRQYEMADLLGITRTAYGKNERGNHVIDLGSIASLHDKLGVSAEWLLFNQGPMFWRWAGGQKKIREGSQKAVSFEEALDEMTILMNQIPFVRYTIMGYYLKFKIENEHLIHQFLEKEEKAETPV